MDPAKLTASLTELVKKFVISFCEVNVGYHDRLDVFGSIHVRSDDSDVVAFVLNEHCYKKPSEEMSDEDDENESIGISKSKASIDNAQHTGHFSIKTESQSGFDEAYENHVKQEANHIDDENVIDIYSDGEETNREPQNNGDVDQNFIDHLLEVKVEQNPEPNNCIIPRRPRGRPRHFPQNSHTSTQRTDSGYYQEQEEFKNPQMEFQNNGGFASGDADYGPSTTETAGEEYKSKFNRGPLSGQRKGRKRTSASLNSLEGSYFQFESTYTCTACGCRFKSMDGLKCHVNSKHLQQRVYSCQFCSQTFLTRQASYSHRIKFHNFSRRKPAPSLGELDFS